MILRLLLLLGIAAGLTLFALYNWSPLALTFLGLQTPALPLGLWILGAIAAGVLTSLLIRTLLSLTAYLAVREDRTQRRRVPRSGSVRSPSPESPRPFASPSEDATAWNDGRNEEPTRQAATDLGDRKRAASPASDDWDADLNDNWEDFEEDTPRDRPRQEFATQIQSDYERKQEPKTSSRSGSVYSYGYREPSSTGVGKKEPVKEPVIDTPVVDADYRVIIPPYQPVNPPPEEEDEEDAEDWFDDRDLRDPNRK
jgi:uncharacterized integral membrane protein